MKKYAINFERINPTDDKPFRRLTYDLTEQTPNSIIELGNVMNEYAKRSGDFKYCIVAYPDDKDVESFEDFKKMECIHGDASILHPLILEKQWQVKRHKT